MELHPDCRGTVVFDPKTLEKWGLVIKAKIICNTECGFISEIEILRRGGSQRKGRKAAKMQVALTKQLIGNHAVSMVREMFSVMDTPTPSESGMQKAANRV